MRLQPSSETVSVRVKELGERHESAPEPDVISHKRKHKHDKDRWAMSGKLSDASLQFHKMKGSALSDIWPLCIDMHQAVQVKYWFITSFDLFFQDA